MGQTHSKLLWEEGEGRMAVSAHRRQGWHVASTHIDPRVHAPPFLSGITCWHSSAGEFCTPGWRFDALSVPAWHWMGFSHNSLTTGNTNEPPLGMASRKAKGLSGHKNSGVEPSGQSLSLYTKAGEGAKPPDLGRRLQRCSKGMRGDHVWGRRAGCCSHII